MNLHNHLTVSQFLPQYRDNTENVWPGLFWGVGQLAGDFLYVIYLCYLFLLFGPNENILVFILQKEFKILFLCCFK